MYCPFHHCDEKGERKYDTEESDYPKVYCKKYESSIIDNDAKAIKLNGRVKILEEDLIAMLKESALGIEFDGKNLKEILNYI